MNGDSNRPSDRGAPGLPDLLESAMGVLSSAVKVGTQLPAAMMAIAAEAMRGPGTAGAGDPAPGSPAAGPPAGHAPPPSAPPRPPVDAGRLDLSAFVALGEGLAAGAGDFALWAEHQLGSFPAQMSVQMGASFPQALLQAPGIGNLPGFQALPVEVPALPQTTALEPLPPNPALGNLSVPGMRLADSLRLRPQAPLVHSLDARQTATNLILGAAPLMRGETTKLPTQLEYAEARLPTLALVALGYFEAVEATVTAEPARLPSAEAFAADLGEVVRRLRQAGAEVLLATVPSPLDTACVSTVEQAAEVVLAEPGWIAQTYGLGEGDLLTPTGLIEIGYQRLSGQVGSLPANAVLPAAAAAAIAAAIAAFNGEVAEIARREGAVVLDLAGLFAQVRARGLATSTRQLSAGYLGGFYTLNGYYPGKTGQALIANAGLAALNESFGARFPAIDLNQVAAHDPVVLYQPAGLAPAPPLPIPALPVAPAPAPPSPHTEVLEVSPEARRESPGEYRWRELEPPPKLAQPLTLPPGLEQILPLNKGRSYFGDALRAADCQDPKLAQWGSCGGVFFGGLAMMDSHLEGRVRIRFSPPVHNITRFEISVLEGLRGDDGILVAPQLYKLPGQHQLVRDFPNMVSAGLLDLATGEMVPTPPAPTPQFNFAFLNTALLALINVNPAFPQVPIQFPGQYGSAWARFRQRPDGLLDFEFFGTTFLPLGSELGGQVVRFPLPFAAPGRSLASIPSRGLVLHPHIHLSTFDEPCGEGEEMPELPTNTVREYSFITHNTSFGDEFNLNSPVLGGPATGRSQLAGRLHVQFGGRSGNTVPIYVSAMVPGGYLAPFPPSPLSEAFPGRLNPGPLGFDEVLRFPLRSYGLDDVFLLTDPWDLPIGAVDVRSGRVVGEQLHRGFIGQDVLFALVRVEPRTPQSSFAFRGPALFQPLPGGKLAYRFLGQLFIPYPEGYLFPEPNLAMGFPVGPDSSLDPFFWIQAVDGPPPPPHTSLRGQGNKVVASTAEVFSYRFDISADPARRRPIFEYTNHSQQGSFVLKGLSSVRFAHSPSRRSKSGALDTVTFAGFGVWSKAGVETVEVATVQISTSRVAPYVGIQIGGGLVSNVNTKPPNIQDVRP